MTIILNLWICLVLDIFVKWLWAFLAIFSEDSFDLLCSCEQQSSEGGHHLMIGNNHHGWNIGVSGVSSIYPWTQPHPGNQTIDLSIGIIEILPTAI